MDKPCFSTVNQVNPTCTKRIPSHSYKTVKFALYTIWVLKRFLVGDKGDGHLDTLENIYQRNNGCRPRPRTLIWIMQNGDQCPSNQKKLAIWECAFLEQTAICGACTPHKTHTHTHTHSRDNKRTRVRNDHVTDSHKRHTHKHTYKDMLWNIITTTCSVVSVFYK